MITGCIWTDTSYFQDVLSLDYERQWVGFRGCDGGFRDPKFRANLVNAKILHDRHRLIGVTVYIVYRPGLVDTSIAIVKAVIRDILGSLPRWITFEIDAETWAGKIKGDHSAGLNRMAAQLAAYTDHDIRRVIGYGNRSDLASMWPHRIAGLRINVASYGTRIVTYPHMIAQQYGDGTSNRWGHPDGLPLSSKQFGHCDHNIFVGLSAAQVALAMGVLPAPKPLGNKTTPKPTKATPKPTPISTGDELDMALTAENHKEIAGIVDAQLRHWLPRMIGTLRHGNTNAAFPAKPPPGAPVKYAGVIDGVGIDGVVKSSRGGSFSGFFAVRDPKTGQATGAVWMVVGDKRMRVTSRAELNQLKPAGAPVHAVDATSKLFSLAAL